MALGLPAKNQGHTGVVIAGNAIEWTTIAPGKTGLETAGSGTIPLPEPPPQDEAAAGQTKGIPIDLKKELSVLKGRITVGIPSDKLLLRTVSLPAADEDEIAGMVQLQVDKFSPFPVETMVVTHEVLKSEGDKNTVLIAAVKQEVVEDMGKPLSSAGLVPHRVDAVAMAWWHLFRNTGAVGQGREIAVLLHGPAPEIIAVQDGTPVVFRSLADTGGLDEAGFDDEVCAEIGQTLLSMELEHGVAGRLSLTLWHRGNAPEQLALRIRGEYQCELHIKAISSLPSISEALARRAAEQDGKGLDLTPAAWHEAEKAKFFKKRMIMAGAGTFGAWILCLLLFFGGLYAQEWHVAALRKKKADIEKSAKEVLNMQNRVTMIRRYTDRSKSSLECLRQICMVQPVGLDLTAFSYSRKEGEVKVSGEADSAPQVYDFKNKLDASGFFKKTSLDGPRRDPRRGREIFDIDMRLPGEGAQ